MERKQLIGRNEIRVPSDRELASLAFSEGQEASLRCLRIFRRAKWPHECKLVLLVRFSCQPVSFCSR